MMRNESSGKKKAVIAISAVIVAILIAIICTVILKNTDRAMEGTLIDEKNGEYMLLNVPKNYSFIVNSKGKNSKLEVLDVEGNVVSTEIEYEDGNIEIKAPEGGYEEGEIYSIDATGIGSFTNEGLEEARKVTFVAERKNCVDIKYRDKVNRIEKSQVTLKDHELKVKGDYNAGDILLVDTDDDNIPELFKLEDVHQESGTTRASYTEPDQDEVYEDIDIFYCSNLDMREVQIDEDELVGELENAGILDIVFDEAYAKEGAKNKLSVEVSRDGGKAECEFVIDVKLPDEKQKLTIKFALSDRVFYKNNKKKDIIAFNNTLRILGDIEFDVKGDNSPKKEKDIEKAIAEYNAEDKANKNSLSKFEIPVLPVEIPLAPYVPVFLTCELGVKGNVDLSGSLNMGAEEEIVFNQGALLSYEKKYKLKKKYSSIDTTFNAHVNGTAKLNCYAGAYMDIGVTVPYLVMVGVDGSAGAYFDAEGYMNIQGIPHDVKMEGYYEIDMGTKHDVDLVVDIAEKRVADKSLSKGKKSLWYKTNRYKSKDVNIKDTYYVNGEQITIGDLEATYYDILTKKDLIKALPDDYELYVGDKKVDVEDGKISTKIHEGEHTFTVKWEDDGCQFSCEKKTIVKELDPLGYVASLSIIGNTGSNIDDLYGVGRQYGAEGGSCAELGNGMRAFFGVVYFIDPIDNARCNGIDGTLNEVFGIEEPISIEEFVKALGVECYYLRDYAYGTGPLDNDYVWFIGWDTKDYDYQKRITISNGGDYLLMPDDETAFLDKRYTDDYY